MTKKQPTRGESLAKAIISEYKPKTVEDMQNALKEVFGPMFEAMLNGEMENHLGYEANERGEKETANRRNGYTQNTENISRRSPCPCAT
jgi:transposase-like protein